MVIKIIIADDESITRQGLSMLPWKEEGFTLQGVAGNGLEALELLCSCEADLLLADIRMPGMDGITLMEKAKDIQPQLKVIFITAYHQFDYAVKAIKLGASGFVLKPTDPDDILNECRKAKEQIECELDRRRNTEGLQDKLKEYQLVLQGKMVEDKEGSVMSSVIAGILRELETRYMEDLTIHSFSKQFHFHPDYLSRLFKKETGDNFVNVLTRIRMHKALGLLADSSTKVYEIAGLIGFRDSRYFGQMFKKRYGVTPQDFRKRTMAEHTGLEESDG